MDRLGNLTEYKYDAATRPLSDWRRSLRRSKRPECVRQRRYADLARSGDKTLELWVRGSSNPNGGTFLTKPLQEAVQRGEVILRRF